MGLLLPGRDQQLQFRLSGGKFSNGPLEQAALILGNYIRRRRPKRSRYLLRILCKRSSPRQRVQHRLRPVYFIVPYSRHDVGLFRSIEVGMPLAAGQGLRMCARSRWSPLTEVPLLALIACGASRLLPHRATIAGDGGCAVQLVDGRMALNLLKFVNRVTQPSECLSYNSATLGTLARSSG